MAAATAFARKSHLCFLFPCNSFYYYYLLDNNKPLFACFYLSTSSSRTSTNESIKIQTFDFLIQKYNFSPQTATKISSFSKNPQRIDSVLEFLQETGFSDTQLEKIVASGYWVVSKILLKRIKSKIKVLEDLGFSAVEIAEIVTSNPSILGRSAINTIIPSLSMLKDLVGSSAHVIKFIKNSGWRICLTKNLQPNIEFLKSCGVADEQISSLLRSYPQFLKLTPENMRRSVDKVDEMGVDRSSKLFIYAVKTVGSISDANWELRLKTFRDLGFSNDDISRVLRSAPVVLSVSEKRINSVLEVLLETGKYDMPCIINCPISLMYSVEKRYKPRLRVLKDLEKKGLIRKWPRLSVLAAQTDEYFFKRFVALSRNEVRKN